MHLQSGTIYTSMVIEKNNEYSGRQPNSHVFHLRSNKGYAIGKGLVDCYHTNDMLNRQAKTICFVYGVDQNYIWKLRNQLLPPCMGKEEMSYLSFCI